MLDLIISGGWLMIPLLLCSVAALAIIGERFWSLRPSQIAPRTLLPEVEGWLKRGELSRSRLESLREHSPLGRILAAGLANARYGREAMRESIEDVANREVYALGRFLNLLSSIAEAAPLIGLLGTVSGMIEIFGVIFVSGNGDVDKLAGGISVVLVNTATGLLVAIPALFCYRFFVKRVEALTLMMEQDAIRLVDLLHGRRAPQTDAERQVVATTTTEESPEARKNSGKNRARAGEKA